MHCECLPIWLARKHAIRSRLCQRTLLILYYDCKSPERSPKQQTMCFEYRLFSPVGKQWSPQRAKWLSHLTTRTVWTKNVQKINMGHALRMPSYLARQKTCNTIPTLPTHPFDLILWLLAPRKKPTTANHVFRIPSCFASMQATKLASCQQALRS